MRREQSAVMVSAGTERAAEVAALVEIGGLSVEEAHARLDAAELPPSQQRKEPTMANEIVERLQYVASILEANAAKFAVPDHVAAKARTVREAAAEIERLQALVGRLREALEPFAGKADYADALEHYDDDYVDCAPFKAGDYRKARATLAETEE